MKYIFKHEFSQFFRTPIGYVFNAIFIGLSGYYFTVYCLLAQSNDVKNYFNAMVFSLMFLLPILTMRLMAEERRSKTEQLLFTSPLTTKQVILGKFFGAYGVFAIGVCATVLFIPILAAHGNVEYATVWGCYVGILLSGAAFLALGLCLSALTDSQLIAVISTYAVLFLMYMISLLETYVQSAFWANIIESIAIFKKFETFSIGIFDPASVVYYISLTVMLLFTSIVATTSRSCR